MRNVFRLLAALVAVGLVVWLGWEIRARLQAESAPETRAAARKPAPVEVASIEKGTILLRRTFTGALESRASFDVAPKVGGRVEKLAVDLADPVERGQTVAWLDDDEYVQAVAQANADLAVAEANRAEAKSALEIADRALQRVETLRERGIASESQLDAARAERLAKQAQLEVAEAQVTRSEAAVETARIRLGYTKIAANWTGGDDRRVVAERHVDEGETVSANAPLMRIVELDPITGVLFVPERDYARLQAGLAVTLATDAYPGETFQGEVERIAPVFRQATRQARVELAVRNPGRRLKPGMFFRATVVLDRAEDATIVPLAALAERDDRAGVFVVSGDGATVTWRTVEVGIRDGDRVQVEGDGLAGRVVTLGQQLLDDGAAITIPEAAGGDDAGAAE